MSANYGVMLSYQFVICKSNDVLLLIVAVLAYVNHRDKTFNSDTLQVLVLSRAVRNILFCHFINKVYNFEFGVVLDCGVKQQTT